ncbi:MAG: di/tricarboxylate transporter [Verrucomicrobiales bacterium]|jgi:di/tricarboxylate transporter
MWQQIFLGITVVVVFASFVREWLAPDLTAMAALTVLLLTGIVEAGDLRDVFGSSAPLIVACMFILSAALERTGSIEALGQWFEGFAGKSELRILLVLMLVVAPLSAFVNNTPVVVVFMPIVLALCRKHDLIASRFLIPLSYAAIVGGTCTIVGTSTNVLATGVAAKSDIHFTMFEVAKLGIIFVVVTFIYMATIGRRLLPDRVTLSTLFESEAGKEFLTQAIVSADSPLAGKALADTPLAKMREIRIIEVMRNSETVRTPLNKIVFETGDQLMFKSRVSGLVNLNETKGIEFAPQAELGLQNVRTDSAILMEGIIGPQSTLVEKTLKQLNFRQRYGVIILALHRRGVNLREQFQDVPLAFGDTLLVEGPPEQMNRLFGEKDFVNLSKPSQRSFRRSKAPIAIGALILFIALAAINVLPVAPLAVAAVLLTLLTRCIDPQEAYSAVDWRVIFLIFGMLGVGKAMENTGAAEVVANFVSQTAGDVGPWIVLAAFYLMTALLTEIISNNAVALLMTGISIQTALTLGVDPKPFVAAVMFGSSASFITPIGYQTNTYVYGAGGYKFFDFTRTGAPLAFALWIIASCLIPVFWPF